MSKGKLTAEELESALGETNPIEESALAPEVTPEAGMKIIEVKESALVAIERLLDAVERNGDPHPSISDIVELACNTCTVRAWKVMVG